MAPSDTPPADFDNLIRDCADLSISKNLKNSRFSLDDESVDPVALGQTLAGGTLIAALLYRRRVISTQTREGSVGCLVSNIERYNDCIGRKSVSFPF